MFEAALKHKRREKFKSVAKIKKIYKSIFFQIFWKTFFQLSISQMQGSVIGLPVNPPGPFVDICG